MIVALKRLANITVLFRRGARPFSATPGWCLHLDHARANHAPGRSAPGRSPRAPRPGLIELQAAAIALQL